MKKLVVVFAILLMSTVVIAGCKPSVNSPMDGETVNLSLEEVPVFFSKSRGADVVAEAVVRPVPGAKKQQPLEYAVQMLLKGPTDEESIQGYFSEIPKGTRLLGVAMQNNGKDQVVRVNLSKQFTVGGGSNSMQQRWVELSRTIRAVEKDRPVYVDVEGKELQILGGEGLVIEGPVNKGSDRPQ